MNEHESKLIRLSAICVLLVSIASITSIAIDTWCEHQTNQAAMDHGYTQTVKDG